VKARDSAHDFERDPITLVRDGGWGTDWLTSNQTTLGSDNGVGAAMALAVLEMPPTAALPPLEALFTVDEETGLTGVQQLRPSLVTGRRLINIDTEQWGDICIGCAGNGTSTISIPVNQVHPHLPPLRTYSLTHSTSTGVCRCLSLMCLTVPPRWRRQRARCRAWM
jgi:dipeptidase D